MISARNTFKAQVTARARTLAPQRNEAAYYYGESAKAARRRRNNDSVARTRTSRIVKTVEFASSPQSLAAFPTDSPLPESPAIHETRRTPDPEIYSKVQTDAGIREISLFLNEIKLSESELFGAAYNILKHELYSKSRRKSDDVSCKREFERDIFSMVNEAQKCFWP